MRGDAAHGVHRDGTADHAFVPPPGPVGPGLFKGDFLFKGGMGNLGGQPLDRSALHAGLSHRYQGRRTDRDSVRPSRVEGWNRFPTVRQEMLSGEIGHNVCVQCGDRVPLLLSKQAGGPSLSRANRP